MKTYYTYILQCSDGTYYTGVTNDLERRVSEHEQGLIPGCYTHTRRPIKLAYSEEYNDIWDAIGREKQLKGWTHRKKQALIQQNWDTLKSLSECQNDSHSSMHNVQGNSKEHQQPTSFDSAQDDKEGSG